MLCSNGELALKISIEQFFKENRHKKTGINQNRGRSRGDRRGGIWADACYTNCAGKSAGYDLIKVIHRVFGFTIHNDFKM